jgi:hypothetical protein
MNIADLTTGSAKIASAYKALKLHWEATKEDWRDDNCRRFEETYLEPLEPQIKITLEAIMNLAELYTRAERECQ